MDKKPKINIIPSTGRILFLINGLLEKLIVELSGTNRAITDFLELHLDVAVTEEVARRAYYQSERILRDDNESYEMFTVNSVIYVIDTLLMTKQEAREHYCLIYGGFLPFLSLMRDSVVEDSDAVAICCITYGCASLSSWIELSIVPLKDTAPFLNMLVGDLIEK